MNRPAVPRGGVVECHLGYACDRACLYCSSERLVPGAADRPAFAPLRRELAAAAARGCRQVSFLGGEPTLGGLLARLVPAAAELGFRIRHVYTNGLRFADRAYARRLSAAGLNGASVNIPSHDEKIFGLLTGGRAGFGRLLKALENLREAGVPVNAVCVLNRFNLSGLADYARFFSARGVRAFTLSRPKYQGRLAPPLTRRAAALGVSMAECLPAAEAMTAACLREGLYPPFLENFVPCASGRLASRAAGAGRGPARFSAHPGLRGAEGSAADFGRLKFDCCPSCAYDAACPGVETGYLRVYGAGEFSPLRRRGAPLTAGLRGRRRALAGAAFQAVMAPPRRKGAA